jgi:hypothetical protein
VLAYGYILQIPSIEGPLSGDEYTFSFSTVYPLAASGTPPSSSLPRSERLSSDEIVLFLCTVHNPDQVHHWGIVTPLSLRFNQPLVFSVPPKIEDLVRSSPTQRAGRIRILSAAWPDNSRGGPP